MRSFPALFPSIAACCLLSFSPAASAQDLAPAFQLVAQAVSDGRLPGATLLVMRHGTVLEHRAFGVRATEPARPFQIDTICWIASLTKPVTATAAMILVERGRLNLEEEVASYLPQFAGLATKDGRRHAVTVRQLLSHTSGIPVSVPLRERAFFNPTWLERGLPEVIEAIAARQSGLEVLGISLVTNLAAGMTGEPLNHEEVLEAGKAAVTQDAQIVCKSALRR